MVGRSYKRIRADLENLLRNITAMAKIKFTKAVIDKLPPPKKDGDTYFAEDMAGFGLRVGKTKKTFFAQKDILGRSCCVTIGTYGTWTVDEARTEARQLLLMMEKGTRTMAIWRNNVSEIFVTDRSGEVNKMVIIVSHTGLLQAYEKAVSAKRSQSKNPI